MKGSHDAMKIEYRYEDDADIAHQYLARQLWIGDAGSHDMSDEKDNEGNSCQSQGPIGCFLYIIKEQKNNKTQQEKGRNKAKDIVDDEMDIIRHGAP
jgi:hypothetical protein